MMTTCLCISVTGTILLSLLKQSVFEENDTKKMKVAYTDSDVQPAANLSADKVNTKLRLAHEQFYKTAYYTTPCTVDRFVSSQT